MAELIDNRENDLENVRSRCEAYQTINADLSKKLQELKIMSSTLQAEMAILRNKNLTEQGRVYQSRQALLEVRAQGYRFINEFEKTMDDVILKTGIRIEEEDDLIDPLQFRPPSRIEGFVRSESVDQYILNTVIEENEDETSSQNSFAPCDEVVSSTPLLQPIPTGERKGRKVLGDIKNSISQPGPLQKKAKTARRSTMPSLSDIPEFLPLETQQCANLPNGPGELTTEIAGDGFDSTQQSSLFTNIGTGKTVVEVHEAPTVASEQTVNAVHTLERTKSAKVPKDPENVSSAKSAQLKKACKTMHSTVNTSSVTNRTVGTIQMMTKISKNATKCDSSAPEQSSPVAEKEDIIPPIISQRRRRNIAASSSAIQHNVNQSDNEAASSSSKLRTSTKKLQSSSKKDDVEDSSDNEWEPYDDEQPNEQSEKRMERKRKSSEEERPPKKSGARNKKKRLVIVSDTEDEEVEPPAPTKTALATKKRKSIETLIRTSSSISKKRRSSGSNQKKTSKVSKSDLNASNASSESVSGRPSRRCRPTSLREPSLVKKMRR